MSLFRNKIFWSVLVVGLAISCKNNDPKPVIYYESSEQVLSYTASQIKTSLLFAGATDLAARMQYDITVSKFNYHVTYKGTDRIASGLICVPTTTDPLPLASLQHGTISANSDAPSVGYTDYAQHTWFASMGYILVIPDYIGFGETVDLLHPYYHAEYTAHSVINMLLAARQYATQEALNFNNKLFLAGYSEGGFATMATHKFLEQDYPDEFDLIASAPAAGAYAVREILDYFLTLDTYPEPFYITYVAMAYKDIYEFSTPLNAVFNEPYASVIPTLFDGTLSSGQINSQLTTDLTALFTADFRANSSTQATYAPLMDAFDENSLTNWVPKAPMYMYHGTVDAIVPYDNSQLTYDKLIAGGASADIVKLIPLAGANHGTGFTPYLFDIITLFEGLK